MNKTLKLYYILLILVIGAKVVGTVVSNGLLVHHGKKIAQLQVQKNNLNQQQLVLQSELAHTTSLATIAANSDISEYVQITQPIVIRPATTVASN